MRIAYILPSCGVSGGVGVVLQHVNRLMERGHEVVLLTLDSPESLEWFPNQRAKAVHVSEWKGPLDILVATGWKTAFWLHKIESTRKCYFVQSDETRFYPLDSRERHLSFLSYFSRVIYFTEAKWIQKWLKEKFGHESFLVPNGLDENIFFPDKPLVPKKDRPRVLLEGAISLPFKGMKEAFEAVMPLDVDIWCVSSSGRLMRSWRCEKFFEHIPMSLMRRIYSSCDVLLKMSEVEGFFGPPLEMMACGGATVVAKVTGYDEYIRKNENALVVESGNVIEAMNAVEQLLKNQELRTRLIQKGLETARAWRWDPSIEILEKEFKGLLEKSGALNLAKEEDTQKTLGLIYDRLNSSFGELELISSPEVPPSAIRLATYLANHPVFWLLSKGIRKAYRSVRAAKNWWVRK